MPLAPEFGILVPEFGILALEFEMLALKSGFGIIDRTIVDQPINVVVNRLPRTTELLTVMMT